MRKKLFTGYIYMIRILVYPLFILTLFGAIRARQLDLTLISPQFFSVIAILTLVGIVSFFLGTELNSCFSSFIVLGLCISSFLWVFQFF